MSKPTFIYDDHIPALVLPELKASLDGLEWLVPAWCSRVTIYWRSEGTDGTCIDCSISYCYRRAELNFYPRFLDNDNSPELRREQVIHDLLHITLGVISDYATDEIRRLIPEDEAPKYRATVVEELEHRCESVTQDLALMIHAKLKS